MSHNNPSTKQMIISVTDVTTPTAKLRFRVAGREVVADIPAELRAYFMEQFVRSNPTAAQRKRYTTLMRLLEVAYRKGREDVA